VRAKEGWTGISDKYFLAAMIPTTVGADEGARKYYYDYDAPAVRVGAMDAKISLSPGAQQQSLTHVYVGPKEIHTLADLNLDMDRAIDYGWFHFLARPLVEVLLYFHGLVGNLGVAIILITVIIKAILFPLADKSYRSMNAMKKLQPEIESLKKKYGDDKQRMNQEMMGLYQKNKVNPLGGCLPIVVQIPVFFALYKVLYLSIEMRHAPFYGWIEDLSAMAPYCVLPVLMGASMFIQQKMSPAPADPMQAKIMMMLPVVFTVLFFSFPAGLVIYWVVNNVLSIAQQGYIYKQMDA